MNPAQQVSVTRSAHRCPAKNCDTDLSPDEFMCPRHVVLIPASLRTSIEAACLNGHELGTHPSTEYLAYANAAIAEVAHKEARRGCRKDGGRGKPAQLALFDLRGTS
jgi:hypothetical protein